MHAQNAYSGGELAPRGLVTSYRTRQNAVEILTLHSNRRNLPGKDLCLIMGLGIYVPQIAVFQNVLLGKFWLG